MDTVGARVSALEVLLPPTSAPPQADQRGGVLRPDGHHQPQQHQGEVSRVNPTPGLALVRGEHSSTHINSTLVDTSMHTDDYDRSYHPRGPRLPKSDFPDFNGNNPKWWKEQCEKYFRMYNVQCEFWVDFATMHFKGNAALWLQTYQALHSIDSWAALCVAVFSKFNRDKYAKILDTFFACRQTESVDEYAHRFEELMHHVLLHNHAYDETFFVHRFIEGLKPAIKSVIKLHKPSTVDLALSLAQTQEVLLLKDSPRANRMTQSSL